LSFSWYDAAVLSQRVRAEIASKNSPTIDSTSRLNAAFDVLFDEDPLA
jgi:hypothetical protein